MKKLLIVVLGMWVGCVAYGADAGLPTLIVAPMQGNLTQIQGWQPALGEGLAEMLVTEMTKVGKFQVLENSRTGELINEINMGQAGYVEKGERVEKGGFAGADFMLVGTVTRFGNKDQKLGLGGFIPGSGGNLGLNKSKADVRIDWRIVDAAKRTVIVSDSAVGEQVGMGFDIGVGVDGHGGNIGFQNKEFMNSALGRATVKALSNIVTQVQRVNLPPPTRRVLQEKAALTEAASANAAAQAAQAQFKKTKGTVLAVVQRNVLIVSLGSTQGLKVGDKLNLYENKDILNDKGEVVFSDEKLAGELVLESVQEDRSKANYAGSAEVKTGWIVKPQ